MLHPPSVNGSPPAFRALLVLARRRRGYSQMKLALAANVSLRHLGFLELGRSRPSADMVLRLASALNLAPAEEDQLLVAAGFAPATAGRAPPRRAGALQESGGENRTTCVFAAALRIQASGAPSEALRLASQAFASLGFEDLLVGCVPHDAGAGGVHFFDGACPLEHGRVRRRMGDLRAFAPALRWAATHPTPFYGRQMIAARAGEPGVARMAAAARDLGMEDALVLPWRMRPGEVHFVVLAVRRAVSDPALALAARTIATALVETLDRLDAPRTPACERRLIRRASVVGILRRPGPGAPRLTEGAPDGGDEACARF